MSMRGVRGGIRNPPHHYICKLGFPELSEFQIFSFSLRKIMDNTLANIRIREANITIMEKK